MSVSCLFPCSSSVASGRQHVNGVDLHYEQTGKGKHAVLLLPGALGKYNATPPRLLSFKHNVYSIHLSPFPSFLQQEALGQILDRS